MNQSNSVTLQSYEDHVQDYIQGTTQEVSGAVKIWLDAALYELPHEAHILEFGSAFGRDAAYVQSLGYTVECTDAAQGFVDILRQNGFAARRLNAITDPLTKSYDLVLANAVLLHFGREETALVIKKVHDSLKPGGTFAFTLKQGEGEGWSEEKINAPRYFCYWTHDQIEQALREAGYADIQVTSDVNLKHATWLHILARK